VFIPAAAGGVGGYAVQIAKLLGAGNVIAGASTEAKRDIALGFGADHAVDYNDPNWTKTVRELTGGAGVDVALEMSGGERLAQTLELLAPFGSLVVFGAVSGTPGRLDESALRPWLYDPALNQSVVGFNLGPWFELRLPTAVAALQQLIEWVGSGQVRVPVPHALPLAEAAAAHRLLESGATTGNLVLKP
jgi:NADPH:quinone reductase-like Zn-dependent oxidoreductase